MKIQAALTLLIVVVLIIGVSVSLVLGILPARQYIESNFLSVIPDIVTAAKADIQTEIARGWEVSLALSRSPFLRDWLLEGETDPDLRAHFCHGERVL